MRKLTSFFTKGGGQLCSTGFSTSPPTVVLKGDKPHASTNEQSTDRLDNLSCVRISEWEYTFRVTYILVARRLSTETGSIVNVVEQSFARKKINMEVNIRTRHVTCHVTSILKITILQLLSL